MRVPFIGQAYQNRSIPVSNQQCINWYPEIESPESRSAITLQSTSGIELFSTLISTKSEIRGMHFSIAQQKLYVVANSYLFAVSKDQTFSTIGTVDGSGLVSMADRGAVTDANGNQIVIATGVSYWVYDVQGLSIVSDAGSASDVAFQDGYILRILTGTDRMYLTETADDARIVNALDFVVGGANPDLFVGLIQVERRIWAFGSDSITIYYNSGNAIFPFTVVDGGSSNGFGLSGKDAKIAQDSHVFWCSNDGRIYTNNGYTAQRISHYGIENSLRKYETLEDCQASEWSENGHKFIAFSFPTGGQTWVFDTTTGMWHQRSSGLSGGVWRGLLNVSAWGLNLVGDRESGVVGKLDLDIFQEYGESMQSRRVTPVIHANQNEFFTSRLELVMEVGRAVSGGKEPVIAIRWSDDSGFTWGNWLKDSLGDIGDYQQKISWYGLGQAKNRVYDLKITDNASRTLIDSVIEGEVGEV